MTVQQRNAAMVNLLRADFQARYEPQFGLAQVISHMLALPGLRGFWPMSSFDESGNAFDLSGQGRTLTYNGNPTYNYDGLAPYIDLDGTGDVLSRVDEAGLDILGTEAYVANPGLTLGGWFYLDSLASNIGFIGKWVGAQASYIIFFDPINGTARFGVFDSIASYYSPDSATNLVANNWYFHVGRYVPSATVDIYINNLKFTNSTGIPASIFNSTAAFSIGLVDAIYLDGRASLCFLCASALSDAIIGNLFQQSRALFGV